MPRYEIVYTVLERSVPLCDRLCNLELCPLLQDLSSFPLPALTFLSHFLQETLVNLINNIKKNRTTADGESFRHTNLKKKKKKAL